METWSLVSSVAHLAAIFATVVLAIGMYSREEHTRRNFRMMWPLGVLLVCFAGAAIGANITSQNGIIGHLVFGMIPLGLALVGMVPVIEWDPFPRAGRQLGMLLVLSAVGWMWSLGSLEVLRLLTNFHEKTGSLFSDLTRERPWEYAAFCLFAIAMAFIEEGIFRGGCFSVWKKYGLSDWTIIFLTSAVWALGHSGYADVPGVKETQIFGLGIVFGFARLKFGLWGAILLHVVHNGVTVATFWTQL